MSREIQVGRFRVVALEEGRFALDGGAMFGVVPRPMWEKMTPVNDDHTIPLSTTPYLVEDGENRIVIEPGIGQRWSDKERARYHIDHSGGRTLVESLARAGVQPDEVTHCLMTHCHWDHIGAVIVERDGALVPDGVVPQVEIHQRRAHLQGFRKHASTVVTKSIPTQVQLLHLRVDLQSRQISNQLVKNEIEI